MRTVEWYSLPARPAATHMPIPELRGAGLRRNGERECQQMVNISLSGVLRWQSHILSCVQVDMSRLCTFSARKGIRASEARRCTWMGAIQRQAASVVVVMAALKC